jgi:hypothetical protein
VNGQVLRICVTTCLASLVLLSFRFAVGAGRSEFVKFLCMEENAVYDMCHTRNYIIVSDVSLCREKPLKYSRYSWSVPSITEGTGVRFSVYI